MERVNINTLCSDCASFIQCHRMLALKAVLIYVQASPLSKTTIGQCYCVRQTILEFKIKVLD